MSNSKLPDIKKKKRPSFFELTMEILGWLQIVASPLLFASIIGFIIYISKPSTIRLIIAIVIATLGLIIGIFWATKIWKKKGTIHFMSRIMATPDLDPPNEETK